MRRTTLPLIAGAILTAASCTDQSPTAPSVTGPNASRVTTAGTGPWARVVEGETGPGSLYALYIPTNWNGDAISSSLPIGAIWNWCMGSILAAAATGRSVLR